MSQKRYKIKTLKVDEISGVDKAAQVPAEALLRKRAPGGETAQKHYEYHRPLLTTEADGHQHVLDDCGAGGETSWIRSEGEEYGHSHSWVRMLDGTLVIGAAEGHTHEVIDPTNKSASGGANKETEPMTQNLKKAADGSDITEAVAKSIADLTTRAERAEAISKLSADERGLFDGLNADGQTSFLAKSAGERADLVRNSKDANSVVFKSRSGVEYRKNDDPRLVQMAKDRDSDAERIEKAANELAMERLTKRAEAEMAHCPGTPEVRAGILKALDGVPGATEFVKAAEASLAQAFKSSGSKGDGSDVTKAADRYEAMAKKYAADNKVSIEQARSDVLDTPEGAALYAEMSA